MILITFVNNPQLVLETTKIIRNKRNLWRLRKRCQGAPNIRLTAVGAFIHHLKTWPLPKSNQNNIKSKCQSSTKKWGKKRCQSSTQKSRRKIKSVIENKFVPWISGGKKSADRCWLASGAIQGIEPRKVCLPGDFVLAPFVPVLFLGNQKKDGHGVFWCFFWHLFQIEIVKHLTSFFWDGFPRARLPARKHSKPAKKLQLFRQRCFDVLSSSKGPRQLNQQLSTGRIYKKLSPWSMTYF